MLRFVDNHAARHLVIVPGWGFDHRIFAGLDLPYDYHVFDSPSISNLTEEVRELVSRLHTEKISLLGWSKGGFAICEFAGTHPELVEEVFLVGVIRKYEKNELENMRENLKKNKAACLKRFYRRCFSTEEMARYQWFKRTLLKDHLETMPAEQLVRDLDWLGQVEIHPEDLQEIERISFLHGTADAIAPVEQAMALADVLPQSQLITFEQTGHMPFLRDDFTRRVYGH